MEAQVPSILPTHETLISSHLPSSSLPRTQGKVPEPSVTDTEEVLESQCVPDY